jgi:hydrogenase-1 operon protein HyaE
MTIESAMLQSPAPHTVPSTPPLVARLVEQYGATWVDAANCESVVAQGNWVVFVAGDAIRFPECLDVAVVLPELQRHAGNAFRIAVATLPDEDAIARRYAAQRRPALVFLRDGGYVTNVSGMLDWDDYIKAVDDALKMPVSRVPGIGIPVVSSSASAGSSCH